MVLSELLSQSLHKKYTHQIPYSEIWQRQTYLGTGKIKFSWPHNITLEIWPIKSFKVPSPPFHSWLSWSDTNKESEHLHLVVIVSVVGMVTPSMFFHWLRHLQRKTLCRQLKGLWSLILILSKVVLTIVQNSIRVPGVYLCISARNFPFAKLVFTTVIIL